MRTKFLIFLFLLVQMGMAQEDRTAPKYDVTRPNGKTTAQINSMTRMVEGSEVWNTDTNSMWLYKNSAWADTTADPITVDTAITDGGANPVTGGTIFDALALKLDASAGSFVTTNTNQTITSNKTFSGTSTGLGVVVFDPTSRSIISGKQAFYVDVDGRLNWLQTGSAWGAKFDHLGLNGLRTYTYPDKDGTFAMLSDIPSGGGGGGGILTNGNQTGLLGNKTWEGIHTFGNTLGSQHNRLVNIYGTEAHLTISNLFQEQLSCLQMLMEILLLILVVETLLTSGDLLFSQIILKEELTPYLIKMVRLQLLVIFLEVAEVLLILRLKT